MKLFGTTVMNQCAAILNHFKTRGALTTLYARENMGIMHPAARVLELRQQGYLIKTNHVRCTGVSGRCHLVASYVLCSKKLSLGHKASIRLLMGEARESL